MVFGFVGCGGVLGGGGGWGCVWVGFVVVGGCGGGVCEMGAARESAGKTTPWKRFLRPSPFQTRMTTAPPPPPCTTTVADAALAPDETTVASFDAVALECGDGEGAREWGEGRLTCTSRCGECERECGVCD